MSTPPLTPKKQMLADREAKRAAEALARHEAVRKEQVAVEQAAHAAGLERAEAAKKKREARGYYR